MTTAQSQNAGHGGVAAAGATGLVAHARALQTFHSDQDVAIAHDVAALFNAYGSRPDFANILHTVMPEILDQHGQSAGLVTAQWYDELDPASKFRAKPVIDINPEQVARNVDWALYAPGDEPPATRFTAASQRLVRDVSRDTVVANAKAEGVAWARYASATACSFCRLLATRGPVYTSETRAMFRTNGGKYHDRCFCLAVPVRKGQTYQPPDYVHGWTDQYHAAVNDLRDEGVTSSSKPQGAGHNWYFKKVVNRMRVNEPQPAPQPVTA